MSLLFLFNSDIHHTSVKIYRMFIGSLFRLLFRSSMLYSKNEIFRFNLFKMPVSKNNIILSLRLGLPTGVQQICLSLGIMTMQSMIDYGIRYLKIIGGGYTILGSMFTIVGFIRETGHTLFSARVTLTSLWLIRIPAAMVMTRIIRADGLLVGIPVGWFFGLIIAVIYYYSGKRKKGTIIKKNKVQSEVSEH